MMIETEVILFPPENNDRLSSDVNHIADQLGLLPHKVVSDQAPVLEQLTGRQTLAAHTGKLAIGVAATLGMMIYYNWRERRLAKQDPEGHARLKRLKAGVRNGAAERTPTPIDQEKSLPAGRSKE